MAFWTAQYGSTTQGFDAWGMSKMHRRRRSCATDTVTFQLPGTAFDISPLPFQWLQPMQIFRNGIPWFYGWVTQPQPRASGKAEAIGYELSGPWYWLEKTIFQQQWMTVDTSGGAVATQTTTRSNIIAGQSLNGVKINTGSTMREVLLYAQYAFQGIDFPTTVTLANLPPAPPANTPFQIGTITPSITIPYFQARDKTCADIVRILMKYSPDAVAWMDYSTSPPTLNITKRSEMAAGAGPGGSNRSISVLNGKFASEFNPRPRYDLQVPAVIVKFEQNYSDNGTSYDKVTVDKYPPAVKDNTPRAWVQTIDLVGGQTTSQSEDIKTIPRPVTGTEAFAMSWIFYKLPWLKAAINPGAPGSSNPYQYDWVNIYLESISTTIDPHDPLNEIPQTKSNPNSVPLPDCHTLINELLTANVPDWFQSDLELDAAKVVIDTRLRYRGTDQATKLLFWYDPLNPQTPKTDGSGYLPQTTFTTKVTNASTQVYSEVTSVSAGEPAPVGFAQSLYEALAPLHFEGELTIVEQECSDPVPIGCVFNTTDGNPDWQTMNALVLSVNEEIDSGTTTVQFGPPLMLGLREIEELFRINLGRLPSFKLDQRTTGLFTAGSNVSSSKHAADTNTSGSPTSPLNFQDFPFQVLWRYNPADPTKNTFQAMVGLNSSLLLSSNLFDNTPITGLNTWFNLLANDTIWMRATVSGYVVTPGTPTIHSFGNGDTDYNPTAAPWTTGGIVENDGASPPNQTLFRKVIAVSTADVNGKPSIKQYVTTDMVIKNIFLTPEPAIYPYPL